MNGESDQIAVVVRAGLFCAKIVPEANQWRFYALTAIPTLFGNVRTCVVGPHRLARHRAHRSARRRG